MANIADSLNDLRALKARRDGLPVREALFAPVGALLQRIFKEQGIAPSIHSTVIGGLQAEYALERDRTLEIEFDPDGTIEARRSILNGTNVCRTRLDDFGTDFLLTWLATLDSVAPSRPPKKCTGAG